MPSSFGYMPLTKVSERGLRYSRCRIPSSQTQAACRAPEAPGKPSPLLSLRARGKTTAGPAALTSLKPLGVALEAEGRLSVGKHLFGQFLGRNLAQLSQEFRHVADIGRLIGLL